MAACSKSGAVPCTYRETSQVSEKLLYDAKMEVIGNVDPSILRGRVVKGVGHLDHVRSYGVREVVSSITDRGNIVG